MALTVSSRKPAPHHKKIRGAHHRHSKHYLKTYHPYLPLLLLVVVGLAVNIFWTSHTAVLGESTSLTSTELLEESNQARLRSNQDSLELNAKLSAAAQAKAYDMVNNDYWSHTSPGGDKPWKFIKNSGYEYYAAGENLAYGFNDAPTAIAGWMNSTEHRKNLLNPDYKDVGFGIIRAQNFQGTGSTTVIVAMYAEPAISGLADFSSTSTDTASSGPMKAVSRIELLTKGTAPWSYSLLIFLSSLAAIWFIWRHLKIWHAVVVKSEEFIVHHKMLDFFFIFTAVAGFLFTRAAGFIH